MEELPKIIDGIPTEKKQSKERVALIKKYYSRKQSSLKPIKLEMDLSMKSREAILKKQTDIKTWLYFITIS